MKPRTRRPKSVRGKRFYGLLVVVMVLAAVVLQHQWMQRAQSLGPGGIEPNAMAQKIGNLLLEQRGIKLDDPADMGISGVEKISCGVCEGTGAVFSEDGTRVPCAICLGVGSRLVRRFHEDDRQCPACAGMGRVAMPDSGEIAVCPRCQGRGFVRRPPMTPESPPPAE